MELRKPGRGRRRKIILGSVIAVVVSAVALPIVSSGAANGPSSDINDYVLYSMSTITLKHGASIGGNVAAGTTNWQTPAGCTTPVAAGTNEYTFNHEMLKSYACSPYGSYGYPSGMGNPHIGVCLGAAATLTWTNPSAYIVAPSVNMSWSPSKCSVPTVYASVAKGSIPTNVWHGTFAAPNIVMPTLPSVTCNANKSVATFAGTTLAPGAYGNYGIAKKTTLAAGATYTFCNLKVNQGAQLIVPSDTVVNVTGNLNITGGGNGRVGDNVGLAMFYVGGVLSFGRSGHVAGTFVAPHDDVSLGDTTQIVGHVWAWAIHSDKDITVTPPPPPPTTTTSTSTSTSTSISTSTTTTTFSF